MTGPSLWGVASALSLILALLAFMTLVIRRFQRARERGSGPGRIDVVSRVALTPRQGFVTVRVGQRTALVSYGEGGVRLLLELDDAVPEVEGRKDPEAAVEPSPQEKAPGASAAFSLLRSLSVALLVSLAWPGATPVVAQDASADSADSAAAAASASAEDTGASAAGPGSADAVASPANPATPDTVASAVSSNTLGAVINRLALPQVTIDLDGSGEEGFALPGPVGVVVFMGLMTLIPTLLLLTTGFTRILIVLHLLKQALGTQTAPPAHLLAAMALLLTGFVMAPTFEEVSRTALTPWIEGSIDEGEMLAAATIPVRAFMLTNTREQNLATFIDMHPGPRPRTIDEIPLVVVMSAFVTSELTTAFQMGFAVFLPFMVIDIVVASVLMSMGMFMLPPVMISLPFKLLLFVLVDGWSLVMGSLLQSF